MTHHDLIQPNKNEMSNCLTLKNNIDELNRLSLWINDEVATVFKMPERTIFVMDLVLTEMVSNIIYYAFPTPCESNIDIKCNLSSDNIKIVIEDDGIAFNPLDTPDVTLPNTLEEANIGGLGIHVVKKYINVGSYEYKDNRNIFSMRLKI